jgi:hypothetical protein
LALLVLGILLVSNASAQTSTSPIFVKKELTGLAWTGGEFIASYGENVSYLLNVSIDGKTITPFAPSFSGLNETYIAFSDAGAGFPKGLLYVSSEQHIYEISPSGDAFRIFSSPPGASRIGYLAFDRVGTWGHDLLAVDDNGLLWSVAANGTAKVIENFGAGQKPEGIAVAPLTFGGLGGYLVICLEHGTTRVVAIPPNDTGKIITLAQFPGEEPERVLSIPPNSDLFAAKWTDGTIVRVPAANLSKQAGSLLVITEGDVSATGSITVLNAVGQNVTQARIFEETDHPHFEGADFVQSGGSPPSTNATTNSGPDYSFLGWSRAARIAPILVAALAVAAIIAIFTFSVRRSRRRWNL